jgi:hypothetical protein
MLAEHAAVGAGETVSMGRTHIEQRKESLPSTETSTKVNAVMRTHQYSRRGRQVIEVMATFTFQTLMESSDRRRAQRC